MKSTSNIQKIVKNGGNVIIDASKKTTTNIISIINEAQENVTIILKNSNSKSTDNLLRILKAAKNKCKIFFDFS